MVDTLLVPAFIAGLFTFLAPCTLPLVPGYLGFISGVSLSDLNNSQRAGRIRRRIFLNGLLYVLGFSVIFVLLGSAVGWLSGAIFSASNIWLTRLGGIFVMLFGLFMVESAMLYYRGRWQWLSQWRLPFSGWLTRTHRWPVERIVRPGHPLSSLLLGAVFAVGWTPCIGPVLGAVLTLAATEAGVGSGALLLAVFSAGLAVPFLLLAAGIGYATQHLSRLTALLPPISLVGGIFIVLLGWLVLIGQMGVWVSFFFQMFSFLNYEAFLVDYL